MTMRKIKVTPEKIIHEYQTELNKGCYQKVFEKYTDPATQYCRDVLDEKIMTCYDIKLMAFRHLQDLRRIDEDDSFDYVYSLKYVKAILNFSHLMVDVSTGNPLELMDWQKSLLCMINAWQNKYTGNKRFNKVIFSVARTNGKTALCAIQTLYSYFIEMSNLTGQEAIFVAPNNTQATKGFSYLRLQTARLREFSAFNDLMNEKIILPQEDQIISKSTQNKVLKMSFESKRFDSLHPRIVIADEVADDTHSSLISEGIDKLTSGQVQIDSPQMIQISTAYPDSNCAFHKQEKIMIDEMERDYERKLENTLCVIYTQDDLEDETYRPETWIKSNPILSLEGVGESLKANLIKERETKEAEGRLYAWQNKNLNCWLNHSVNNFVELDDIENAIIDEPPINIEGREVYIGVDLSNFSDDTSVAFMFPYGENQYYVYQHSWIPLARSQNRIELKENQDNIAYRNLEKQGYCTITKNKQGFINYDEVYHWLMEFIAQHKLNVKALMYDRWRSDNFVEVLEQNADFPLVPVQQNIQNLNDTTKEFQRALSENKIHYLHDEIITTALKNAILVSKAGMIKVDKDSATEKIDCVDAMIDAFYRARLHFHNINFDKPKKVFGNQNNDQINEWFQKEWSL